MGMQLQESQDELGRESILEKGEAREKSDS